MGTGHWHHRRSRSVKDGHTHCPCNGTWLCPSCHEWAHHHPFEATAVGFIVSRFTTEPGDKPLQTPWGERLHDCTGQFTYTEGLEQ